MILNIFIVLIMFIPFYVALIHKHSGWLTAIITFFWCSVTSALMILLVAISFLVQISTLTFHIPAIILLIVAWGWIGMYYGLKITMCDSPRYSKN